MMNKDARGDDYQSLMANLDGVKIHYLKAGTGKMPLVLLHGFGETSQMWIPLFEDFGQEYTIIAPDICGLGVNIVIRYFLPPSVITP